MSKLDHINAIRTYLGDGFIQFPADMPPNLEFNGVNIEEYKNWVDTLKASIEAIDNANYLNVIPEGVLSSLQSGIEQVRNAVSSIKVDNINEAQTHFNNAVGQTETLLAQVAPYLNLADVNNYRNLENRAQELIKSTSSEIDEQKKTNQRLSAGIERISKKSEALLGKVDSGVLHKELDDLSKSWWHGLIMAISIIVSVIVLVVLIARTQEFVNMLMQHVTQPDTHINWSIYFGKWLATTPYIIILIFALLESRRRISLIDQFIFRSKVAKSLEGYRLLLLHDLDKYGSKEREQVRLQVSQFMITAILGLINQPNVKERNSVALRFKDLFEVKADNE